MTFEGPSGPSFSTTITSSLLPMKHKHHILPRHVGGTDDPSNIVELSIQEHAEAHKKLFEQYGRWQDYYAWLGLSGMIGKKELISKIQSAANKGKIMSEETKRKIGDSRKNQKHSDASNIKNRLKAKERWKNGTYENVNFNENRKDFKQTDYQKQRAAETFECAWIVTSPEGASMNIINLRKFCKNNGLDQGNMVKVSQGKAKHHKGWNCSKISA